MSTCGGSDLCVRAGGMRQRSSTKSKEDEARRRDDVPFENDKIRLSEMKEKIRRLVLQLPECIPTNPERVLFVHPLLLLDVLLPAEAQDAKTGDLGFRVFGEEVTVCGGGGVDKDVDRE
jgi:hypothetical protein